MKKTRCRFAVSLFLSLLLLTGVPGALAAGPGSASPSVGTDGENLRVMLVRSLNNADFPQKPNQPAILLRKQIEQIADYAAAVGCNAILFEARPQGDALYRSEIFPNSRFFVRSEGDFCFFAPRRELIAAARKRSLLVYALINPYSLGDSGRAFSAGNPASLGADAIVEKDGQAFFDPSQDAVADLNAKDIAALSDRYGRMR